VPAAFPGCGYRSGRPACAGSCDIALFYPDDAPACYADTLYWEEERRNESYRHGFRRADRLRVRPVLSAEGWDVLGIDTTCGSSFSARRARRLRAVSELRERFPRYRHYDLDIRDREGIRQLFAAEKPGLCNPHGGPAFARQSSLDSIRDFDTNAVGTLNVLVACRDFCPESPVCFTSTNKVYGDRPNELPLVELENASITPMVWKALTKRCPIDRCLHSLFGASKVAADVLCQEFGRYFGMPVGVFRGGCLTGPRHSAVELHGYLALHRALRVTGKEYPVFGLQG